MTIMPPKAGPTAGAIAQINEAMPMTMPIFLIGTCSKTMLTINGKAIPVPIPCKTRPKISKEKEVANAPNNVPTTKKRMAVQNKYFKKNRFFRYDDNGIISANINK